MLTIPESALTMPRNPCSPSTGIPAHHGPEPSRAARELRDGPGVVPNFEHPLVAKILAASALGRPDPADSWQEIRDARRPFPVVYGLFVGYRFR